MTDVNIASKPSLVDLIYTSTSEQKTSRTDREMIEKINKISQETLLRTFKESGSVISPLQIEKYKKLWNSP